MLVNCPASRARALTHSFGTAAAARATAPRRRAAVQTRQQGQASLRPCLAHPARRAAPDVLCRAADAGAAAATGASASTTLYVSQLAAGVKADDLASHFGGQAGYESAFVMEVEGEDGGRQHLGFVQFGSPAAAAAAQQALDGSTLGAAAIRVSTDKSSGSSSSAAAAAAPASSSSGASEAAPPASSSAASDAGPAGEPAPQGEGDAAAGGSGDGGGNGNGNGKQRQRRPFPPKTSDCVLFCKGLPKGTTEDVLRESLGDLAGLTEVMVFKNPKINKRRDGFLTFADAGAAAAALQALSGAEVAGQPLVVAMHGSLLASKQQQDEQGGRQQAPAAAGAGKRQQQQQRGAQGRRQQTADCRVGNLAWATTNEGLTQHFRDCKGFVEAFIVMNRDDRPSGWGYAKFASQEDGEAAVQALGGSELDGRTIQLEPSRRPPKPDDDDGGGGDAAPRRGQQGNGGGGGSPVRARLGREAWALRVTGLPPGATDEDLREHFGDCEGLEDAFVTQRRDGRPSGQGFVRFGSSAAMVAALKAKRGSQLDGSELTVEAARPGRVEAPPSRGAADGGGGGGEANGRAGRGREDPLAGAAVGETRVVLYGLPPSFTWREAMGLCSVFGQVNNVKRSKSNSAQAAAAAAGEGGDGGDAEAAAAAAKAAAEAARRRQPTLVEMNKHAGAVDAVVGLHGRIVQGYMVHAHLYKLPRAARQQAQQGGQQAEAGAGGATTEEPAAPSAVAAAAE